MLNIDFQYDSKLDNLEEEIKIAVAVKLTELTRLLYDKVIENVSGKILQKQTGQLAESIITEIDIGSNPMIGSVLPLPQSPKAFALEKGGEKSYTITPSKATMLKFYWDKAGKTMFLRSVNHPPSKEFAYLRSALEDMESLVPEGFQQALDQVLGR